MPWSEDREDDKFQRPRRFVCERCQVIILHRDNLVEVHRDREKHVYCGPCAVKESGNASGS